MCTPKKHSAEDRHGQKQVERLASIYSLAPSDRLDRSPDGADYTIYEKYLNEVFSHTELHNIAITGNYGVGKSSIIHTFDRKRNQYHPGNRSFLYISLANFCGDSHDGNVERQGNKTQKTLEELERDLLCQILYVCDDIRKVPGITYRLIPAPKSWYGRHILGIMLMLLTSCLFLTIFGSQLYAGVKPFLSQRVVNWYGSYQQTLLAIPYGLLLLCLLFFVRRLAGWLSGGAHLSKLTIEGSSKAAGVDKIGVDIQPVEGTSYLDRHGFELIYVLERMADQFDHTVVFEDMDLLGVNIQRELFSELRGINCLANSRLSHKRRAPLRYLGKVFPRLGRLPIIGGLFQESCLRFFYVAHDMEFSPAECSKFFDYILPVIPTVSSESLPDRLAAICLEDIGIPLDEQAEDMRWRPSVFFAAASPELNDYRTIHTILNEYHVFEQVEKHRGLVTTKEEKRDLFAFVTYKNLCPEDYYAIRTGKSTIFPPQPEQRGSGDIKSSLIQYWVDSRYLPWDCVLYAGYSLAWLRETYTVALTSGDEKKKRGLLLACADGALRQQRLCMDILLGIDAELFPKIIEGIQLSLVTYLLQVVPETKEAEIGKFEEDFRSLISQAETAIKVSLQSAEWHLEQSSGREETLTSRRFGDLSAESRQMLVHYLLLCKCQLKGLDTWLFKKSMHEDAAADIWRLLSKLPQDEQKALLETQQEVAFQWISTPDVLRGLRCAGERNVTLSLVKMMIPPGNSPPPEVGDMVFEFRKDERKALYQWLDETQEKKRQTQVRRG